MKQQRRPIARDGRGVSDVFGTILIFGVMIMAITSVFTLGIGAVEDRRDTANFETVAGELTEFASGVEAAHRGTSPGTHTTIPLEGGQLVPGESVSITITTDAAGETRSETVHTTPVVYEGDNRRITYAAGLVYRSSPGNSTLVERDLPIRGTNDQAIVEIVNSSMHTGEVAGGGDAVLSAEQVSSSTVFKTDEDATVTVTVEGEGAAAWGESLASNGFVEEANETQSSTQVTYTASATKVAIREANVTVTIGG